MSLDVIDADDRPISYLNCYYTTLSYLEAKDEDPAIVKLREPFSVWLRLCDTGTDGLSTFLVLRESLLISSFYWRVEIGWAFGISNVVI